MQSAPSANPRANSETASSSYNTADPQGSGLGALERPGSPEPCDENDEAQALQAQESAALARWGWGAGARIGDRHGQAGRARQTSGVRHLQGDGVDAKRQGHRGGGTRREESRAL